MAFDPSNKEHRKFYYEFLENNTWGRCPVRFICPSESGMDLIRMMQRQLVEYYVREEFKDKRRAKAVPRGRKSLGLTQGGFDLVV